MIYKKKKTRNCDNQHGISLLSITSKVIAKILLIRLKTISEQLLPETQCGFHSGRSTAGMIFTLRQLQEKAMEQQRSLYIVLMDFSKAFNTVNRWDTFEGPQSLWLPWVIYEYDQTVPWWHDGQSVYWRWYQWCLPYQSQSETGLCFGSYTFHALPLWQCSKQCLQT